MHITDLQDAITKLEKRIDEKVNPPKTFTFNNIANVSTSLIEMQQELKDLKNKLREAEELAWIEDKKKDKKKREEAETLQQEFLESSRKHQEERQKVFQKTSKWDNDDGYGY
ncbi:hypothetical protein ACMXYX_17915 (plasmid) [Neptuniibacter sp. QD72_48]|uniref:hypothetical protein n=1 Tax=Neptuniibacter sp. QD72_48 TaxID=3398214 RepID=UPI0039F51060